MEDELKCIYCNDFYCNPVLLPCFHSLCYACALQLQEKFNQQQTSISGSTTTLNNNTRHSSKSNNNNEISMISNAIVNAAKSAIALSSSQSPTSQNSLSPSSSVNMDCTLSINDFGSSIVSDLDKLSVFSETELFLGVLMFLQI